MINISNTEMICEKRYVSLLYNDKHFKNGNDM